MKYETDFLYTFVFLYSFDFLYRFVWGFLISGQRSHIFLEMFLQIWWISTFGLQQRSIIYNRPLNPIWSQKPPGRPTISCYIMAFMVSWLKALNWYLISHFSKWKQNRRKSFQKKYAGHFIIPAPFAIIFLTCHSDLWTNWRQLRAEIRFTWDVDQFSCAWIVQKIKWAQCSVCRGGRN